MTRQLVLAAVVLLFGCSDDMGEQTLQVQARGLWLTANPLDAPPGALGTADNAVIRRPGVVEPRRGQKPDTDLPQNLSEMASFEGDILAHGFTGAIYTRTDVDTFTTFAGPYTAPTGHPMRFAEAGGGLYFTTDSGPQRMDSPTTTPVAAGIPPGLEGSGTTTGSSGWLATGRVVGYRFVWGARDADGALLLGAPSGRIVVTNSSGGTRDVALVAVIPSGIVTGTHFLQVYRTVTDAASGDDPGEDMAQVAEVWPTAVDITNGTLSYTDAASFANGPTAYFSPSVGAGIADAKQQPPLLTDAIAFKGYLFGVVQAYRQTLILTLLGVGAPEGLDSGDGINIFNGPADLVGEGFVAGASELPGSHQFEIFTGGTAAQNIENTMRSLVRVLNQASTFVTAQYVSSANDLPGKVLLTARSLNLDQLRIESSGRDISEPSPWVPALMQPFSGDVTRASNVSTVSLISSSGLAPTMRVRAFIRSADANFPEVTTTIASVPTGLTITFANTGPNASATALQFAFNNTEDTVFDQEAVPGSWATSAFQEPDAWPPRFRYQIGGPNTTLQRITAQGEALLFWTSDGLYRLTGNDENDFTLRPVDPTVNLVGTSTPATMGNKAFALTTQGVVSVTDLGVEKVSTPVDQALLPYYASTDTSLSLANDYAFGVAYQSENEYYLFLPSLTGSPTAAQMAYVFNTQTGTWVRHTWEWDGINNTTKYVTAGVVGRDNYLYLGSADWIMRERKDRALTDYQDADGAGIPMDVAYNVETAKNPGALKQWTEVACLLQAPQPSTLALYFTTEIDSNEAGGTITSQGNKAVRTYVPRNMSRSARLNVGLRHSTAQEKPTILGLSVVYNTTSTRVGR